ncbi:MAG: MIP/aquaporin family protein [Acidimicrobiales bacterium]
MFRALRKKGFIGELSAEMIGTFIILIFGDGVVAQVIAGGSALGDHNSIAWAWGFAVAFGVYAAGRISGAHLNPAVTLTFAVFRGFSWRKAAPYALAQTVGAFLAALVVRWDYAAVINKVDPHHTIKTGIIFATEPGNGSLPVSVLGAFRDQIIGTAILLFLIFVIIDTRLYETPLANLAPLLIGFVVVAIGFSFGTDSGYAINPARDLGPRVAEFITGYHNAWRDQYGSLYFWVPIAGPLIGGLIGGGLYELLLGRYLPVGGDEFEPGPGEEEEAHTAAPSTAGEDRGHRSSS